MSDWLCPLKRTTTTDHNILNDDGPPDWRVTVDDCHAVLHVSFDLDWPIDVDHAEKYGVGPEQIARLAYTSSWQVVCENGHVLAAQGNSADDYAEPFLIDEVMAAIGAVRS